MNTKSPIACEKTIKGNNVSYVQHIGWLRHDLNEKVIYLLRQGHFEPAEQAFFWLYLRPDDTFFDCGAHIGLYSILASKATAGGAHIVAIEANRHTALHLDFNLKSNGETNATIVNAAIWDSLGEIRFLESKKGDAAYDHVDFGNADIGLAVTTTTLNKLVEDLGKKTVALVKIDVEGAESEAIAGGKSAMAAGLLPMLMVEFTESNLRRRGLDTSHLYQQLEALGYTLCTLHPERLQLEPFKPDGPIWYKNLFACKNLCQENHRLKTASDANRSIALDILARGKACTQFRELENLEMFKKLAEQCEQTREWAESAEARVATEQENTRQAREWAESAEARVATEQENTRQAREWAENAEARVATEQENTRQAREWAESAEARVATEQENTRQAREWAENAEARAATEQENTRQAREWAESAEARVATEQENTRQAREWAENAEARAATEQENTRQAREWAESAEARAATEQENTRQAREWAESAEARVATEQENTRQAREWAENAEARAATEQENTRQARKWAENAEARAATEQENTRQARKWAERSEQLLTEERATGEQLRERFLQTETLLTNTQAIVRRQMDSLKNRKQLLRRLISWRLVDD